MGEPDAPEWGGLPAVALQVRLPAQRPVKAVREPMDQYCGEANADAVFKGEV